MNKLDSIMAKGAHFDEMSRLTIAALFMHEKNYSKALQAINTLKSLPGLSAQIGIYIAMNRLDLAERQVKLMQSKDDFSSLTQLALAEVRLVGGDARMAHDLASELEEKYKATPMLKNIQAAAAIVMRNYTLAKEYCESALEMDSDNPEALVNMIYVMSELGSQSETRTRYYERLRVLHPNHELVQDMNKVEQVFSRA